MNSYFSNILMLIMLSGSLLSGCSTTPLEKNTLAEVQARFLIGSMAGRKLFEITGDTLHYKYSRGDKIFKQDTQKLSHEDIKQFEEKLISTRASNWSGHYNKPGLADGIGWSFEYRSKNINMKSSGSNTFPNNFDDLNRYISETLLKGKPFR